MSVLSARLHPERLRRTLGAASCVRPFGRFVSRELRGAASVGCYRLRDSGLAAVVRHPLLDMWVLEEVFRFRVYEPPAEAGRALDALGRPPRVLDLGGHVGFFGLYMSGLFEGARITSFEPDPGNAATLGRCVQANSLQQSWEVIEACAAASDRLAPFASSFHLSRIAPAGDEALDALQRGIAGTFPFLAGSRLLEPEPRTVACRDVLPFLAQADLVKIDIEGGEWEILEDERFAQTSARAIVLEYHPAYAPRPDPDEVVAGTLRQAGFTVGVPSRGPDAATLWAWKPAGATS